MSVPVVQGTTWAARASTKLSGGAFIWGGGEAQARGYDVTPVGRRFLMIKQVGGADQNATPARIVVVQNWFEELKQRVPLR